LSLVLTDVPDHSTAVGVPARIIPPGAREHRD
jgi:serine acetyltransferase